MADAGPLIALARVGRLHFLRDVFGRVLVPDAAMRECLCDRTRPDAQAIVEAVNKGLLTRARVQKSVGYQELAVRFGDGETAAITLALNLGARVLLDDGPARAAARELGVEVIGTGGALIQAKRLGRLAAVKPVLLELQRNGYHLSPAVVKQILARCGEGK